VPDSRAETGRDAETIVADHLEGRGFEIVARNVRVGRLELDIIARRGRLLVVCEVRSRRSKAYGSPALTIDRGKIAKVRRATAIWLKKNRSETSELRFDAAAVTFAKDGTHELAYYERAF
jgi:putative endonuclease